MKLASYSHGGAASYGVVDGEALIDVGAVLRERFIDLKSVLAAGALAELSRFTANAGRIPCREVQWLPVIGNPDKILCVGLNYENHRQETGRSEVAYPTIFARFANSQTGHLTDLQMPHVSTKFDYEGELAVIIGRTGRYIAPADVDQYIAGYACYNDGSIRDYQQHAHQFTPGKNFPHTGGFGPYLVTADDVGPLAKLVLQTRLNGQVVQNAPLGDMIFDVPTVVAYCSQFTRLEPGDVIAMGTPGGVGARRQPPLWMKVGDTVEVEIDRVGKLINTVGAERLD